MFLGPVLRAVAQNPTSTPRQIADSVSASRTWSSGLTDFFQANPPVETVVWILGAILVAWLANNLTRRYILRVISRVVTRTKFKWDDVIFERKVFRRLAHIAPAIVIYYGATLVPGLPPGFPQLVQRIAMVFVVLVVALSADRLLTALNDLYSVRPDAKNRPIKGYLQIVKIVLYVAAGILVVSTLLGRDPIVILGGFGAMTAVILLIFKDTILSLVASIQIAQYDMIAVGDWIEMPKYGVDGDVIDIALHTIKVQNFDKTITTVPTHKFIEDSFKNWRGMSESGGRRIKRSIHLDVNSIRFLTDDEIAEYARWEFLHEYVERKQEEIGAYNAERREAHPELIPNTRRLTNVGTLRAYIVSYLRKHSMIHKDMTLLIRQLEPGAEGLPLQIYVFSNDTDWVRYEGLQADIFDHIYATLPKFDLRAYQSPSGADIRDAGEALGRGGKPA